MKLLGYIVDTLRDIASPPNSPRAHYDVEMTEVYVDDTNSTAAAATAASFHEEVPFRDRAWSYYQCAFGRAPVCAGDLLLGIGLDDDDGEERWLVPRNHPIAELLMHHDYDADNVWGTLHSYARRTLVLGQYSLARILEDKALLDQGALWESADTCEAVSMRDEEDNVK